MGVRFFLSKWRNKNSLKQSNFSAIFMAWEIIATVVNHNEITCVIGKKG